MEWHENKKGKKSKIFPISQCSVGHFFQALLNVLNKSEFPQQNPESNHLFENIQSLKDLHFGCHFIKVFLKVLENRLTSHLIKKKSRRKFRVISLNFFFRSYTSFKKNERYLSLQFCITSRKYPYTENVSNCAHFSVPLENKR